MSWYLSIRGFCILSFIVSVACLIAAGCNSDWSRRNHALAWGLLGVGLAAVGCLLLPFGWTPEHP